MLNIENSFQPVSTQLTFPSLPASITATLAYEGASAPMRTVNVTNGLLNDMLAPNDVNIYKIGCHIPPIKYPVANLAPNSGFEMPSTLGGVTAWGGGRVGWYGNDGTDRRARMFLDTTRPHHGRYALRIVAPTAAALTTGWSMPCVDSYYPSVHPQPECNADGSGTVLAKNTKWTVSLWARSAPGGMRISIVSGSWKTDPVELAAFHEVGEFVKNQTIASAIVNGSWQRVSTYTNKL